MSDQSFLAHFITEDLYLIKEDLPEAEPLKDADTDLPKTESTQPEEVKAAPAIPATEAPSLEAPAQPTEATAPTPAPAADRPLEKPLFQTPVVNEPEPVYLKPLPTEGSNLKHCLILVESESGVLEANLKGLLAKIMGAVKRSLEDVLLVNVKGASTDQIDALLSEQNHRHLIVFGPDILAELSEVGKYEITQVNRKHYLKADSLSAISEDVALKKALWKALQEMF